VYQRTWTTPRARQEIQGANFTPPRTEAERLIAEIWQDVLQVERVGLDDNFFDLGGHSILMVRVHSKLRELLHSDITLVDMFKYPTISALAGYLSRGESPAPTSDAALERARTHKDSARRQRLLRQRHRAGENQGRF